MRVTNTRPDWHSYWMTLAVVVAARGTCLRRQCGTVIVKDNLVLSSGYNGTPAGLPHCDSYHPTEGCYHNKPKTRSGSHEGFLICRAVHSEVNAIVLANTPIDGAYLYTTNEPCKFCTEVIINSRIGHVFYFEDYDDQEAREMRADAKLVTTRVVPFSMRENYASIYKRVSKVEEEKQLESLESFRIPLENAESFADRCLVCGYWAEANEYCSIQKRLINSYYTCSLFNRRI